jgi:hypothetical protein
MGANAPIFFLPNVYNPALLGEHFKYTLFFILPHLGFGDTIKNYRKATLRFFIGQSQQHNFRSKHDRRPR